jgi:hypothetical protein
VPPQNRQPSDRSIVEIDGTEKDVASVDPLPPLAPVESVPTEYPPEF